MFHWKQKKFPVFVFVFNLMILAACRTRAICEAFYIRSTTFPHSRKAHIQKSYPFSTTTMTLSMVSLEQSTDPKLTQAKIVSLDKLGECGARLREGNLVAFPTETVYGLGCNALDSSAVMKVFEAKERPLTDPLITHVSDHEVAFDLWKAPDDSTEAKALRSLCKRFWPGPLTLVAEAAAHVPAILMANTGFVACRAPQHPISIALIEAAKVPIAAPSANKFGHVSPTRAYHVWDDLEFEDVWIVDAGDDQQAGSVCDIGVESSVAKIEMMNDQQGRITLLRQGAVCVEDIQVCLEEAGLAKSFEILARTKKATDETVAHVAPGQTIRHYSPDIPSFMLSQSRYEEDVESSAEDITFLSKTVIIDFRGKLKRWKDNAIAYRELTESGDSASATKAVFETLRWAEQVESASQIIFPEIIDEESDKGDALTLALKDRLTRAASGVVITSFSVHNESR